MTCDECQESTHVNGYSPCAVRQILRLTSDREGLTQVSRFSVAELEEVAEGKRCPIQDPRLSDLALAIGVNTSDLSKVVCHPALLLIQ